jgi:predicted ABC-type sugar transport system permease subunit
MDLYLFAREFEVSIVEAARPYLPYLWRTVAVGCAAYAVLSRIEIPNLVVLVIAAVAVGLVYLLVVWTYLRRSELGVYINSAITSLQAAMRTRVLSWSNNS